MQSVLNQAQSDTQNTLLGNEPKSCLLHLVKCSTSGSTDHRLLMRTLLLALAFSCHTSYSWTLCYCWVTRRFIESKPLLQTRTRTIYVTMVFFTVEKKRNLVTMICCWCRQNSHKHRQGIPR